MKDQQPESAHRKHDMQGEPLGAEIQVEGVVLEIELARRQVDELLPHRSVITELRSRLLPLGTYFRSQVASL